MPNHIQNRVTFECSEERLTEILGAIAKDDVEAENGRSGPGTIDFEKIIPMPENIFRGNLGQKERELYDGTVVGTQNINLSAYSRKFAASTVSQKKLIEKILRDFPDSKNMLEFDDYIGAPTIENASEFISRAIEDNFQHATHEKTYADYIATRPRAEKLGKHGLFSNDGDEIILSKVPDELNAHEGNMWTMIVSLRREDAERLNYDNATAWRELLRAHTSELADALKIPLSKLKWYAAFHNESHHPHIHLLAYTDNPQIGFLTKQAINNMRSALGNDIFQEDLQHIFTEQTERRNALKKDWHELLEDILKKISESDYQNSEIERILLLLSEKLTRTKGKKVYGYLKRDVKDLIDSIVDLLAEDENISKLYDLWYEKKYEILRTYTSELPPKIPLSQNKEFKSIKNEIIREAMRIHQESGKTTVDPPKTHQHIDDTIGQIRSAYKPHQDIGDSTRQAKELKQSLAFLEKDIRGKETLSESEMTAQKEKVCSFAMECLRLASTIGREQEQAPLTLHLA